MNLIDAWPLVLILAAGIGIGRWIERRRAKRNAARIEEACGVIPKAGDDVVRAMAEAVKPRLVVLQSKVRK